MESSKYSHRYTYGLANYKEKALAVGCSARSNDCSYATEIFDMNTLKWSDGPDFPFGSKSSSISGYSTAKTPDAAYIIGGGDPPFEYLNLVAEFRNNQWTQLNDLNKGRLHHGSITVGAQTMIVGGSSSGTK